MNNEFGKIFLNCINKNCSNKMRRIFVLMFFLVIACDLFPQVRNGWRSIYDTSGRLTRTSFYDKGSNVIDSNFYFQYYTDNILKGIISGEISRDEGCKNGSVILFDETGNLTTYNIKREGQLIFNLTCEYLNPCAATWVDQFDVETGCWNADSFSVVNSEFVLHNDKNMALALYDPPVPVNIKSEFVFMTKIPKDKNSSKLGVCLGWKDPDNYYLFEISYGEYYSVLYYENGVYNQLVEGRKPIEKKGDTYNEIKISSNGNSLIFEINQNIEMVIPTPDFKENTIGLMTRSRGSARFMDIGFTYPIPRSDPFYTQPRIGKGTGFFISSSGKILTTYDAIADAKSLLVKGMINGKQFLLPAEVISVEEERNIAILQVKDRTFKPFDELPYGLSGKKSIAESNAFSIGFPNAISGIYMTPEMFPGKVLPSAATSSTDLLLEMSFRYGMIGSPVFDNEANLIGIVANKGMELKYTEVIDFFGNSRLLQGHMGRIERTLVSPLKTRTIQEKYKALSEIVVIVESQIFDTEGKDEN